MVSSYGKHSFCIDSLILWDTNGNQTSGIIDSCFNIVGSDSLSIVNAILKEYELSNAYHNPFNPITTISYAIPNPNNVLLSIYDLSGKRVKVLKDEHSNPAKYEINWDAINFHREFTLLILKQKIQ